MNERKASRRKSMFKKVFYIFSLFLIALILSSGCSGSSMEISNTTGYPSGSVWPDDSSYVDICWDVNVVVSGNDYGKVRYGETTASMPIEAATGFKVDIFEVVDVHNDRNGYDNINGLTVNSTEIQDAANVFRNTSYILPLLAGPDLTWEVGYNPSGSLPD